MILEATQCHVAEHGGKHCVSENLVMLVLGQRGEPDRTGVGRYIYLWTADFLFFGLIGHHCPELRLKIIVVP